MQLQVWVRSRGAPPAPPTIFASWTIPHTLDCSSHLGLFLAPWSVPHTARFPRSHNTPAAAILLRFCILAVGSMAIGVAVALACAAVLKRFNQMEPSGVLAAQFSHGMAWHDMAWLALLWHGMRWHAVHVLLPCLPSCQVMPMPCHVSCRMLSCPACP